MLIEGDVVVIRKDIQYGCNSNTGWSAFCTHSMLEYAGRKVKLIKKLSTHMWYVCITGKTYYWTDDMFEGWLDGT